MLNVFTLNQRINESAGCTADVKSVLESVDEYEFVGSIDEASSEFAINLMNESVSLQELITGSEEIMVEAAINNPERLDTIQESVFSGIKAKVLAVIDKIIAMVKGIKEKLKEFYYKLTGKTDKWAKVIKPRIDAAKRRSGYSEAKAEMYAWQEDYVITDMSAAIAKLMTNMYETINKLFDESKIEANDKLTNRMQYASDAIKNVSIDHKENDADSNELAKYVKATNAETEAVEKLFNENKEKFPEHVATILGEKLKGSKLSTANMEDMWKSLDIAVKGNEKTTRTYGNRVDSMLEFVKKSSNTIKNIQKAYDKHLSDLGTLKRKAETAFNEDKIKGKLPEEAAKAAKQLMTATGTSITSYLTMHEGAINTARDKNTKYLQEMSSEYMSVLTKFAGIKSQEPKEKSEKKTDEK